MSEIVALGYPPGHVWLASPRADRTVTGETPIRVKGLRGQVEEATVKQTRIVKGSPTDAQTVYAGPGLPDDLVWDTREAEDGAYDIEVRIQAVDGSSHTLTHRVIVDNWEMLEDPLLRPSQSGWFGEIDRLEAVDRSPNWVFVGDPSDTLFGDADRIRPDGRAHITWQLPNLSRYALNVYAFGDAAALRGAIALHVSPDGERWEPAPFEPHIADTDGGWVRVTLDGTVPAGMGVEFFRLTAFRSGVGPPGVQIGHVRLYGARGAR